MPSVARDILAPVKSSSVRRRAGAAALPTLVVGLLIASTARADAPAPSFARWLPDLRGVADGAGRLPVLVELPPGRTAAELGLAPLGRRFAGGHLLREDVLSLEAAFPGVRAVTGPRKQPHLERVTATDVTRAVDFRDATGLEGRGVVVGVVDTGIDVTHPTFRDPETGKTRIAWLLATGTPRGVHADLERRFGCDGALGPCAVWSADDIDLVLKGTAPIPDDLRDPSGHGTHVAGIAAGNGRWPAAHTDPDAEPRFAGMAPAATLVIAAPAVGGGFSDPDILNGTAFVFDRAEAMGLPAVVNLSLGGDFGPHDGTSLLEKALADLVGDDRPGRAIVVSSGNSGGRVELGGELAGVHTEARVRPSSSVRVPLVVAGRGSAFVWVTMRAGDDVAVGVEGRDGDTWIGPVGPGDESGYEDGTDGAVVINALVNERSDLTSDTNGAVLVVQGEFDEDGEEIAVVLEGEGDAQLWVASSDAVALFRKGLVEGTVAVPATHPRLVAVGSSVSRTQWKTIGGELLSAGSIDRDDRGRVSTFSACGPTVTGVMKPELVAPGQFVVSAMSADADPRVTAAGIFSGACPDDGVDCMVVAEGYAVSAGTSMASPVAAGAMALLLDRDPNLTQGRLVEIFQAGARRHQGRVAVEGQYGPGALDLVGALAAFAGEDPAAGTPPDPSASFWSLSTSYARPDPSWPVHGLVQLRRSDGTLASGLDGSGLALEVEGGLVQRAPVKVRHGTFAFTVSGRRGGGGSEMRVRVLHDGVPIGETKVLPMGGDAFAATEPMQALGGCDCSAGAGATSSRDASRALAAVVVVALAVARRRSSERSVA